MNTKYIFASSLLALMVGMSTTSCDSTDGIDDPIELPAISTSDLLVKEKPIVNIPADKNASNAKVLNFTSNDKIEKIITTCDGAFIAYVKGLTRATSSQITGSYTVSNGMIVCTIRVAGETITVTIPQSGSGSATVDGTPAQTTTEQQMSSGAQTASICRTWYPTQYQAVVYSSPGKNNGERKIFGNYSAPTLKKLEETIEAETKTSINLLGGELQKFSLLADGTIVSTINNTSEVNTWSWVNEGAAEFKASFGSDKQFQNLPGFVRYQAGTPNTAEFVLECEVDVKGKDKEIVKGYVEAIITAKDAK